MAIAQGSNTERLVRVERQLQLVERDDLCPDRRKRLGAVGSEFGGHAEQCRELRRYHGFSQVTLTSTFNSVVPQLIELSTGGITLTASACYPNNF